MHGELVHIHHGEYRVQVHKRPVFGDVEGQHLGKAHLGGQKPLGQLLNGPGLGALGDAHRHHLGGEHQDVAPLHGGGGGAVIVHRGALVLGMVGEDILGEEGLPPPGDGVHPVDGHPVADGGEGVPGKVQVRDGVQDKGIVILQVVGEVFSSISPHLGLAQPGHHGGDHVVGGHGQKVVGDHGGALAPPHPRLADILQDKLLLHPGVGEGLGHQVGEIHHLGPVAAQQLTEGVVLLLGDLQIGDVVKEQTLQIVRHQIFQLAPGPVEQHPLQGADLAFDVNGRLTHAITPFGFHFSGYSAQGEKKYTKKFLWPSKEGHRKQPMKGMRGC